MTGATARAVSADRTTPRPGSQRALQRGDVVSEGAMEMEGRPTVTQSELRRLCDDIHSLDSDVHADIIKHLDEAALTRNANGVFFDLASLDRETVERVRGAVEYAKSMRERLAEHDRELFESSQRLVSGPICTGSEDTSAATTLQRSSSAALGATAQGPVPPQANGSNASTANTGSLGERAREGEEAFCVRMEQGCIAKPPKGVFLKKLS